MIQSLKTLGKIVGVACMALMAGCQAAGALAYAAHGPSTTKAQYVPKQDSMLVLVESYGNAGEIDNDAEQLGVALAREMTENKVAPLIDASKCEALRDADPEKYRNMNIEEIGRAVGAKQVLYVNVVRSEVEAPGESTTARGNMAGYVRIVDSATADTRWPMGSHTGALVEIQTSWTNDDTPMHDKVHRAMINKMALQIGRLFYDWQEDQDKDNPDPNLGPN
jgi:hypothetical protein